MGGRTVTLFERTNERKNLTEAYHIKQIRLACVSPTNKIITTMTPALIGLARLRSLIWGFGKSCTIVYGITSQPTQYVLKCALYGHCCCSPTNWLNFERVIPPRPSAPGLGGIGGGESEEGKLDSPPPYVPVSSQLINEVYLLPF